MWINSTASILPLFQSPAVPHRPGEEEVSTALQEVVEHKGDEDMTEDLSRREEEVEYFCLSSINMIVWINSTASILLIFQSPAMPSRPEEEEVVEPKGNEDMIEDLHEEEEVWKLFLFFMGGVHFRVD